MNNEELVSDNKKLVAANKLLNETLDDWQEAHRNVGVVGGITL